MNTAFESSTLIWIQYIQMISIKDGGFEHKKYLFVLQEKYKRIHNATMINSRIKSSSESAPSTMSPPLYKHNIYSSTLQSCDAVLLIHNLTVALD